MGIVDTRIVLGGTPFKLLVTLFYSRLVVKLNVLVNIGVNYYLIINKLIAYKI